MTWLLAMGLALAALALGIVAFRVPRDGWTSLAAALVLGLAGYALQASPHLAGAPTANRATAPGERLDLIEIRRELSGSDERQPSNAMILADAMTRQGQNGNAATILGGAVREQPEDAEAWLALGNALVEHAEGRRTRPAMLAYRRAEAIDPDGLGPAYFLGLTFIRDGQFGQTRSLWAEALAEKPEDAPGRRTMTEQLARLDQLLAAIQANVESASHAAPPEVAGE